MTDAWEHWSALTQEQREMLMMRAGLRPPNHPSRHPLRHPVLALRAWWQRERSATRIFRDLP